MSPRLNKTNQSKHDSDDFNDPNPEVDFTKSDANVDSNPEADFNVSNDDDDDEDKILFMKNLVPVKNSFVLVLRKSNGEPTFLMYDDLSEGEVSDDDLSVFKYCCNDSQRLKNRTFAAEKIQGSNSLSENASPSGLDKMRENDQDQGNGADTGEVALNCLSQDVNPSRYQGPSIIKKVSDDGRSTKEDKVARASTKKRKNDRDDYGHTRRVGSSKGRGLMKKRKNDQDDYGHTRRVGSSRGRGLMKKRKNDHGNGAEKESNSMMEVQVNQGNSAEKAQLNQGNSAEKTRSSGIMEASGNRGNGGEKARISVKIEARVDQDYGDSNRSNGIWLRNYSENECDIEDGNVETCSDSEVEVLDRDPHCTEWVYTPVANSKMEDDDVHYIRECSKPENLQFRKDVEDILKRPYDKNEYDTLWLQVNSRKPKQGHKELRGGRDFTYAKATMGKSYLDEYIDLQKVLDTLRNDLPRKLNVLRGFFFYLQKMATEGIFKPWLDESCMAIVPIRTE